MYSYSNSCHNFVGTSEVHVEERLLMDFTKTAI